MTDASPELFIGLMSGTSMDGIDAALVSFEDNQPTLICSHNVAYSIEMRGAIDILCKPGVDEIDRMGQLDIELGWLFAQAALELLEKAQLKPEDINAIGSHGQTVRHRPDFKYPFTLQITDPNVIAHRTGITTVADFRRRDMAASGQGAPLVPAFHAEIFCSGKVNRAILNIGGIANFTLLPKTSDPVIGFDTGPGNGLMNDWAQRHLGKPFDDGGKWASSGVINEKLLAAMLEDPYFAAPPPKSTGREHFNAQWLNNQLNSLAENRASEDVAATIIELTAVSIAQSLQTNFAQCEEIIICGGGAHNTFLCDRIQTNCRNTIVRPSSELGIDPDWVEAIAFAWLAKRTLEHKTGNLPSVTGASESCILGGVYFA